MSEPTAEARLTINKAAFNCARHAAEQVLCLDCALNALLAFAQERVEQAVAHTKQAILPSLFVEEIQVRERRIASLEAELARVREERNRAEGWPDKKGTT